MTRVRREDPGHEYMTVLEVARLLRVDTTTVKRWIYNGQLEAFALPGTGLRKEHRIPRAAVNKILGNSLQRWYSGGI